MRSSEDGDELRRLLPKHGGYRKLRSFQSALRVYDATMLFCDRFIERRSRTHDQMVQAARSGVRNIAEGSMASGTSKKTELKLTNVARASLEELLGDYEDFLRQHRLRIWAKDSSEALAVRGGYRPQSSEELGGQELQGLRTASAEVFANTLLCWINQASYLMHRQLDRLERDFLEHGGFTENLYAARRGARQADRSDVSDKSDKSDASDKLRQAPAPACPVCGKPMRLRTARTGARPGEGFWGCSGYPDCRGTRPLAA